MTQERALELPRVVAREHCPGECSPSPSVAGLLVRAPRSTERSEARDHLNAPLWLTSLQRPGVFEVVPTKNVSRFGVQMVTQEFWEPADLVLFHPRLDFASRARLCIAGSSQAKIIS